MKKKIKNNNNDMAYRHYERENTVSGCVCVCVLFVWVIYREKLNLITTKNMQSGYFFWAGYRYVNT